MIQQVLKKLELPLPEFMQALSKKQRTVLFKAGGFGRGVLRRVLARRPTKRQRSSKPGEPPKRQTGRFYGSVAFDVDFANESFRVAANADVAEVLQEGGMSNVKVKTRLGQRTMRLKIRPRPYLDPARPKIEDNFSRLIESEGLL